MPVIILVLLFVVGDVLKETDQAKVIGLARGWQVEVPMPDGTRCDLLTPTHAIEVDWAPKYAESCGQAVLYSIWTGKKPGVLLLIKDRESDKLNVLRCKLICERVGIDLEVIEAKRE